MQIDYVSIGNRIKQERESQGITQEKLAELCGLSIPHMSNVERAHTKVSLPALIRIANALGCTLDTLVCDCLDNNLATSNSILNNILEDCTGRERTIITSTIQSLKDSLSKVREDYND